MQLRPDQHAFVRIVRIFPEGYLHYQVFDEVVESLLAGLRANGIVACVVDNQFDPTMLNIVIGAHLLSDKQLYELPHNVILYNFEQFDCHSSWIRPNYIDALSSHRCWDYSRYNIAALTRQRPNASPEYVPLGYAPPLTRLLKDSDEEEIDVLFYGCLNPRRKKVLDVLAAEGYNVQIAYGAYGAERDSLIRKAKLVLNIHYYDSHIMEAVRVSYLMANSKAVVSECADDTEVYSHYRDGLCLVPYDELVHACVDLLTDFAKRRQLEKQAFSAIKKITYAEVLMDTLLMRAEALSMGSLLDKPYQQNKEKKMNLNATHYLDLIEKILTGMIYEDNPVDPWSKDSGFDVQKRLSGRDWPSSAHTMIGLYRLRNIRDLALYVISNNIPGDFVETGVWRGGAVIYMRAILKALDIKDRLVWAADSFEGLPEPEDRYPIDTGDKHHTYSQLAVSLEKVQANFAVYGLLDEQVKFLKGWFKDTLPAAPIKQIAILRLDGDMYSSTMDALISLYDKVSHGGFIIIDDYGAVPSCKKAVHDFRDERGITSTINNIDNLGVFWQKILAKP